MSSNHESDVIIFRRALGRFAAALIVAVGLLWAPRLLPYAGQAELDALRFSTVILDADGGELQVLPLDGGLRRLFVPISQLPKPLIDVVVGAEDGRFWIHPGFDPASLLRASFQYAKERTIVSGASTISMQLARLIRPRERSIGEKIAEIWEATQLESRLGKKGVLELYLNLLPFGRNIEGFPAAARVFFGRPISALTPAELAVLAVMPRGPSFYDPFEHPLNNAAAANRLAVALDTPSLAEIDVALRSVLDPSRPGIWPFRAPQFVIWLSELPEFRSWDSRRPFRTGIEPSLQAFLETTLTRTVDEARAKRISNAAALFARPDDMRIAAWVGSIDFFDASASGQIDGVRMRRQPGSTLKPFLYSIALGSGFTASSILPDIPTDFGGSAIYTPANFNDQFNGPVRLRQALSSSLNVPAVYTLERIGVKPTTEFLIANGFESLKSQRGSLGLGLALGNAEVSLFELVQGYGLFLSDGIPVQLNALPSRPRSRETAVPLIDKRIAILVRDILTRHPDRTLAFGRGGNTRLRFEGAIKTGTSNQFNNIWAVGFTPDLLGGVWMGNFSGETVVGTADSGYPAGIIAKTLESFSAREPFPPIEGLERRRICSLSGKLATGDCPFTMEEWYLPGTAPAPCDWHSRTPKGIAVHYPQEYQPWLSRYRYRVDGVFSRSSVRIQRPTDRSVFFIDPALPRSMQELAVEATGTGSGTVYLDGRAIYQDLFPLRTWLPLSPGSHRLEVRAESGGDAVTFKVN